MPGSWLVVVAMAVSTATGPACAAPKADLWEVWSDSRPDSQRSIDHAAWDAFLQAYVRADASGLNRVAYADVAASDREALRAYIGSLAALPIRRYSRAEQLAYWINLYNALTVNVVLDAYPVESIREIRPRFFSIGPWSRKRIEVEGESLSLDDIEHRILRPIWRDPRIHYAVNCASVGCPNLRRRAFTAANVEAELAAAAPEFINSSRGVWFEGDRMIVSRIYHWFEEDFGGSDAAVIDHLKRYAAPDLLRKLEGRTRIDGARYDWRLNDARGAPGGP